MTNPHLFPKPQLFHANKNAPERILINQGGTSSGKTYAIIDLLFEIATQQPQSIITIVGQDVPNLKVGAFRDAKAIYYATAQYQAAIEPPNETDRQFACHNGSIIEFKSYADEQDAKSGKRDYLFVNEANGVPYPIYWQLATRTRHKIFIDYNPSSRFWVHKHLLLQPDTRLFLSDHRANPFLTPDEHRRIETIDDPERFKVYARGLTGKLIGLIYTNWQAVTAMPIQYKKRYIGIDFGFTNDPTAIIDLQLSGGELYIDQLCYNTGLTNPDIADLLAQQGIDPTLAIVADSAEPKSIEELQRLGYRVQGAYKGPDSILNGIDILKRYKWNITHRSTDIMAELLAYSWYQDRDGYTTNEPIDKHNHALDAIRYIALNKLSTATPSHPPRVTTTQLQ